MNYVRDIQQALDEWAALYFASPWDSSAPSLAHYIAVRLAVTQGRQLVPVVTVPVELLESLVDTSECRFDHHGGCQSHGYLNLQPGDLCPQAELKQTLQLQQSGRPQ